MNLVDDLKERFASWAQFYLERSDILHGPEAALPKRHDRAVTMLEKLRDSVDSIPPSLIYGSERLRAAAPDRFDQWLGHGIECVGFKFFPANAADFVGALNGSAKREMASA